VNDVNYRVELSAKAEWDVDATNEMPTGKKEVPPTFRRSRRNEIPQTLPGHERLQKQ
jgi:hypothetical protein